MEKSSYAKNRLFEFKKGSERLGNPLVNYGKNLNRNSNYGKISTFLIIILKKKLFS